MPVPIKTKVGLEIFKSNFRKMEKRVLALDLSSKRSGWATRANGELEYGAITASSQKVENRIGVMRDEIVKLIKKYNITHIIAEEVRPDGMNNHTGKVLNWLQGVIAVAAYEANNKIEVEFIGASSWRSKLKIQGKAVKREQQKAIDIKYAKDKYDINVMDDEADAIGILDAYEIQNPTPIILEGGFQLG